MARDLALKPRGGWSLVTTTLALALLPVPADAQGIGRATARLGFARDGDGGLGSGSVAAEARFAFRVGGFEMGPKVGYARLGSDASVWEPGILVRQRIGEGPWKLTVHGALSGLIYETVADLPGGGTFRDQDGFLGGEAGVGVVADRGPGVDLGLEAAIHRILQNTGGFEPGFYWTVTLGVETDW